MKLLRYLRSCKVETATAFAQRTFSGIQPTGTLHLGNYLGAVKGWVDSLQQNNLPPESNIFAIVDLHAITLPQKPDVLRKNILEMAASLLACGLDPDRCLLFQQSRVHQHTELAWILGCNCPVPSLQRLTQYKEKSEKLKSVPLGLFIYPVLQSADILLYKGTHVPVGEDNLQNVEICRQVAKSFNAVYGKTFPIPVPVLTDNQTARVRSLRNPAKKMSKSDPDTRSCIYINDTPDVIVEKCKKAVTDMTSQVTFDPENRPGVSNLISIHSGLTGLGPEDVCLSVTHLNTGQYKLHVAEVLVEHFAPIREKIDYYLKNQDHLDQVLTEGSSRAQAISETTMADVRKTVGFKS